MSGATDPFTSFIQRGIGPKKGMGRIPLPSSSYQHPSVPLDAQRLLNMFAEQEPANARSEVALIGSPGLASNNSLTFDDGPVVQMSRDFPACVYAVSGTHFYRQTNEAGINTIANLGEIGSPAGDDNASNLMVTIAVGVAGAVVCVPPNAFTCTHTGALNQITGSFPGARSVAYLDGYFVFSTTDISSKFFTCLLLDPTMFDALDFAFADGVPNVVRRIMPVRGELWMIGDNGQEVWYDAGAADFPFRRQVGGVIRYGTLSPKTCALCDNSLFWVGNDCIVYRSNGYQALRVSDSAIEAIIEAGSAASAQWAFSYTQAGHIFYCLTIAGVTLVYDCLTRKWHNRSSAADGSGVWRPSCAIEVGGVVVMGDSGSGRTVIPVPRYFMDDTVFIPVAHQITLPPIWGGTNRAFMNRVEIEMEVGGTNFIGPVLLEWSDDGGITFTGSRTMNTGGPNQNRFRVYTTRLGSFHQRVLRITTHGLTTIYAVDADITQPLLGG